MKDEIALLMTYLDNRWGTEPEWHSPQGFVWNDFDGYPTLVRYLVSLRVHLRLEQRVATDAPEHGWLTFPPRGGCYSPDWMVDALCANINAKIAKYVGKPVGLAAFYLLVHYDFKAFAYNSPVDGINFSYAEAVAEASHRIAGATGVFDGIFVYIDTADGQKCFKV